MRYPQLDQLKLILAVLIVGLHTNVLQEVSTAIAYALNNGLARLAVPLFFMLSGYFLAQRAHPKIWPWAKPILLLYGLWQVVYLPFYTPAPTLAAWLSTWAFGYWHLWYLNALLLAGGVVLWCYQRGWQRPLAYTVVPLYLVGCIIQYLQHYAGLTLPLESYRNALWFGLPFMVLGTWADTLAAQPTARLKRWLAGGLLLLGAEVYAAWALAPNPQPMDLYFSLIIVVPALLGLVLKHCQQPTPHAAPNPPRPYSAMASGLYLLHPLLMHLALQGGVPYGSPVFAVTLALSLMGVVPLLWLAQRARRYWRLV